MCPTNSYISNGKFVNNVFDKTLKDLNVDTVYITGHFLYNAMDAKELGYKTFVVSDATDGNPEVFDNMVKNGVKIVDTSTLLLDIYKCPENSLQCPSSGDCVPKEKQCDGYSDCSEDLDEEPKVVITNCCDEIILSGNDPLSMLWYHKYMGTYVKMECSRYYKHTQV